MLFQAEDLKDFLLVQACMRVDNIPVSNQFFLYRKRYRQEVDIYGVMPVPLSDDDFRFLYEIQQA